MSEIVVLAPVLRRPDRALPVAQSLRATGDHRLVFLCSPGDREESRACQSVMTVVENVEVVIVPWESGSGDYARKINYGVRHTSEPWIFQGADDLHFHDGWAEVALSHARRTGKRVIGTNDLGNVRVIRGRHSTHSLVARSYIEELGTLDGPGAMMHEGYFHNFCDDEMIATARARKEFAMAIDARVEHLHPNWGKGARDKTYDKGEARFAEDRQVFYRRVRPGMRRR